MKKTAGFQRARRHAQPRLDKQVLSRRWLRAFGFVAAAGAVVYAAGVLGGATGPATSWGMAYGIAAVVVLVGVLAHGGRRRALGLRVLGRSWHYLQVHVYGGLLFILLMFMHVGFRMPQGVLTWWLWFLSLWVVGTGLFGLALQKGIPTLLASGLQVEVHFDRIPELIAEVRARAEELARTASEPVRVLYRQEVAPVLNGLQPRWIYYMDVTGGYQAKARHFDQVRKLLPEDERARLDDLHELYRTKMGMDAHYTLQRGLRLWLYLHVPAAVVVLGLVALHIFFVFYY